MADQTPQSEMILYQTADGRTRIQCRFENETNWLSQVMIAEEATIKSYLIVRAVGRLSVWLSTILKSRIVQHHSRNQACSGARQP